MASGLYFVYVNSDDTLLPSALISMSEAVFDDPNVVLCGSGLFTDELSKPILPIYSDRFIFPLAVFGQCLIVQPSTIIPAQLYKQTAGFNPDNICNWDHELLLALHKSGANFKALPQRWSTYRLHQNSITSSKKLANLHTSYRHALVRKFYPYVAMNNFVYTLALFFFWLLAKLIYPKKSAFAVFRRLFPSSYACRT